MKKLFLNLMMACAAITFFTACEDVPEPYTIKTDDDPSQTITPQGDGTLTSPYNVAAADSLAATLSTGEENGQDIYIKGIVSTIKEQFTTTYGNGTFYISDDGTTETQFYVYRAYYLNNKKFSSGDSEINIGDTVIICGRIMNYSGTYETVQNKSYIYSINGGGGNTPSEPGTAEGDGTQANPFNCVAANAYASSLASNAQSDKDVYIKGKIVSIKEAFSTTYGNSTFYISDDGTSTNQFYVFRTLYLGNVKYTSGDLPQVGDDVIICGKVMNYYGNTPETVANESYIYSLTSNGGGGDTGDGDVSGNSITASASALGLANGDAVTTVTLSDGTTLSFDGGSNTNAPKYYSNGNNIRMYPKNTMTVKSSKTISSIKIACDTYNGTLCNASGNVTANPGTVSISDADLVISGINSTSTVITDTSSSTGAASQIRWTSITITYAE